jgi:hypothetical protein
VITETIRWTIGVVAPLLPETWSIDPPQLNTREAYPVVILRGPDGRTARLLLAERSKVWPRDIAGLKARLPRLVDEAGATEGVLIAPWLSPQTRKILAREGVSYIDREGSVHLSVDSPAVFIHVDGSDRNPAPQPKALRSLRGRGAGRPGSRPMR